MATDIKYHLFRSLNNPTQAITIGEMPNGVYFLPSAVGKLTEDENAFTAIEEIERLLDDKLEMIIKQND